MVARSEFNLLCDLCVSVSSVLSVLTAMINTEDTETQRSQRRLNSEHAPNHKPEVLFLTT